MQFLKTVKIIFNRVNKKLSDSEPWEGSSQSILDLTQDFSTKDFAFRDEMVSYRQFPDNEKIAEKVIDKGIDLLISIIKLISKHDIELNQLKGGR